MKFADGPFGHYARIAACTGYVFRWFDISLEGIYSTNDLSRGGIVSHGYTANHTSVLNYVRQFAEWGYYAFCFYFCGGCLVGMSDGATPEYDRIAVEGMEKFLRENGL